MSDDKKIDLEGCPMCTGELWKYASFKHNGLFYCQGCYAKILNGCIEHWKNAVYRAENKGGVLPRLSEYING